VDVVWTRLLKAECAIGRKALFGQPPAGKEPASSINFMVKRMIWGVIDARGLPSFRRSNRFLSHIPSRNEKEGWLLEVTENGMKEEAITPQTVTIQIRPDFRFIVGPDEDCAWDEEHAFVHSFL
jgi:hypothetical protein